MLSFFRVPGQAKVQIPEVLLFVFATTIGPYQRGAGLVYFSGLAKLEKIKPKFIIRPEKAFDPPTPSI